MRVQLGEVAFSEVFPFVHDDAPKRQYEMAGTVYSVKVSTQRLVKFRDSQACAICGLVGTKLILDLPVDTHFPHFNMYAEENGRIVLMTIDHIKPRSLGGKTVPENLRTACTTCNVLRGNNESLTDDQILQLRKLWPDLDAIAKLRATFPGDAFKVSLTDKRKEPEPKAPVGPPTTTTGLAWQLVQQAYLITSALSLGDEARARAAVAETAATLRSVSAMLDERENKAA